MILKDIKGYEGLYKVSDDGDVYRVVQTGLRKLKPYYSASGYTNVDLSMHGVRRTFRVHRLVADAFCPRGDEHTQVNHLNEVKDDNRAVNLQWCTAKENANYGTRNARIALARGLKVICLELACCYPSIAAAAKDLGLSWYQVKQAAQGTRDSVYGLHFCFLRGNEKVICFEEEVK